MKWSERWFRLLLRAFPAGFRRRHGDAMTDAFRDAMADHRGRGPVRVVRFLVRTTLDVVLSGVRERLLGGDRVSTSQRRSAPDARPRRPTGVLVSWIDVKLGLRMLVKHPGLTLASTFALAVGIPVGLAPDHFVDGITAPLPVPEGESIRSLRLWSPGLGRAEAPTYADFDLWREALESFDVLAAFRQTRHNLDAEGAGGGGVRAAEVSASAFDLLQVAPLLGRTLQRDDTSPGAPEVVVMGYDVWQARYAGDPDIVGRTIRLGGAPHVVVGVMPDGFLFPVREGLWTPLRVPSRELVASSPVQIIGRLADGVPDAAAEAELVLWAGRAEVPGEERQVEPQIATHAHVLMPGLDGDLRSTYEVRMFRVLAWMVFLVACGNVGMLFFARAATRRQELAVRTALGASRGRVLVQAFVESMVSALLAVGVGLLLMSGALDLMWRVVPSSWSEALPYWIDWRIDASTVVHALALAAVSAVVAGVLPAIRYTGRSIQANIQKARSQRTGGRFGGLTGALIVVDVAVAVGAVGFSLTTADLLTRVSESEDLVGIPADEYLAVAVHLAPSNTGGPASTERMAATQEELVRRLRAEPGVRGVAVGSALPRMQHNTRIVEVEGVEVSDGGRGLSTRAARVSPDFFASLGAPVLAGRAFDGGDLGDERSTVVVNTRFVEHALQGQNALGRRIRFHPWGEGEPGPWKEIVGVVGQLGMRTVSPESAQGVYEPLAPGELETVQLGIHLGPNPSSFAPRLRTLAAEVDAGAIVSVAGPLSDIHEGDWYLTLAASLGAGLLVGVLLALAASGVYAIMSFAVSQRITEIGIRAALGAGRSRLVISVVRRAAVQLGIGVLLGLPLAAGFLLGDDGSPYVGAGKALAVGVAVLLVVGLTACTGPTLRALRVGPNEALRADG